MKAEVDMRKMYPKLKKIYKVEANSRIRPYHVHWRKLLKYLNTKKESLRFEMDVEWIKEERILHKKRVFLNLTNDL